MCLYAISTSKNYVGRTLYEHYIRNLVCKGGNGFARCTQDVYYSILCVNGYHIRPCHLQTWIISSSRHPFPTAGILQRCGLRYGVPPEEGFHTQRPGSQEHTGLSRQPMQGNTVATAMASMYGCASHRLETLGCLEIYWMRIITLLKEE